MAPRKRNRPCCAKGNQPKGNNGTCAFCWAFADILYAGEIATIIGGSVAWLIGGASIGQLKLVSSDLRGSEVSGAVWGSAMHLKSIHQEITQVWDAKEVSDEQA